MYRELTGVIIVIVIVTMRAVSLQSNGHRYPQLFSATEWWIFNVVQQTPRQVTR